ncbi:MAG: hypothetical protein IT326_00165 [Anaerolineae bacterium]|nr:hypothetical protein [Anaerolineae bacterium]
MTLQESNGGAPAPRPDELDWRTRALLAGGLLGAVAGIISAVVYIRAAERASAEGTQTLPPTSKDALRMGMNVIAAVRAFGALLQQK